MIYLFSLLYVIGGLIVLLNLIQLVTQGWATGPIFKTIVALLFIYCNYRFQKEAFKRKRENSKHKQEKK